MEEKIFNLIDGGISTIDALQEKTAASDDEIAEVIEALTGRGVLLKYYVNGAPFFTLNTFTDSGVDRIYRLIRAGIDNRRKLSDYTGESRTVTRSRVQTLLVEGRIVSNGKIFGCKYSPNPDYRMPYSLVARIKVYDLLNEPKTIPQLCERLKQGDGFIRNLIYYLMLKDKIASRKIDGKTILYFHKNHDNEINYISKQEEKRLDTSFFDIIRKMKNAG